MCRPGRFDYHIEVPSPDRRGREAILRVYLRKMKRTGLFRVADWARQTEGFSGAELAALCREAGLQAILRGIAAGLTSDRVAVVPQDMDLALRLLRQKRAIARRD